MALVVAPAGEAVFAEVEGIAASSVVVAAGLHWLEAVFAGFDAAAAAAKVKDAAGEPLAAGGVLETSADAAASLAAWTGSRPVVAFVFEDAASKFGFAVAVAVTIAIAAVCGRLAVAPPYLAVALPQVLVMESDVEVPSSHLVMIPVETKIALIAQIVDEIKMVFLVAVVVAEALSLREVAAESIHGANAVDVAAAILSAAA